MCVEDNFGDRSGQTDNVWILVTLELMVLCYFWYLAVSTQSGSLLLLQYFSNIVNCICPESLAVFLTNGAKEASLPDGLCPP